VMKVRVHMETGRGNSDKDIPPLGSILAGVVQAKSCETGISSTDFHMTIAALTGHVEKQDSIFRLLVINHGDRAGNVSGRVFVAIFDSSRFGICHLSLAVAKPESTGL